MEFNINHPLLYILAGIIVVAVLGQSVYFLIKTLWHSKTIGFTIVVSRILYKKGVL